MAEKQVSEHARSVREYLDADGNVLDNEVGARIVRYTSIPENFTIDQPLDDLPTDILYAYAAWGFLTRWGNATNSVRNAKGNRGDNAPQSEREALERMQAQAMDGLWTSPKGEGVGGTSMLAEAIVRAKKRFENTDVDKADVEKWLAGQDKEARAALRKRPAIATCLADIAAERAKARAEKLATEAGESGLGDIGI